MSAMDFIAHLLCAREACGDDYPRETHNRRSILFDPISPKECLNYSFFEGILRSTCLLLRGIETRFSFLGNWNQGGCLELRLFHGMALESPREQTIFSNERTDSPKLSNTHDVVPLSMGLLSRPCLRNVPYRQVIELKSSGTV